jgi:hypothetical protein
MGLERREGGREKERRRNRKEGLQKKITRVEIQG